MYIQEMAQRVKAASAGLFNRPVALIGIVIAVIGPFLLLTIGGREANNLPWYIWTGIPLLLLIVISVGLFQFMRKRRESEDISISPDRQASDEKES